MQQREKYVIIGTVALLVVVAAIILTVAGVYTDGFQTEFRHFYVSVNRDKYLQDADVVMGNVQFDVQYVLKRNVGYTVQILPAGDDFTFQLNGQWLSYKSEIDDLTEAFDIELGENSFIIRCRQKSMQDVLEAIYPESTVYIPTVDDVDSSAHYKLVVTAGDGSQAITLTFRCWFRITSFEIDPPSLLI